MQEPEKEGKGTDGFTKSRKAAFKEQAGQTQQRPLGGSGPTAVIFLSPER